MVKNEEYQKLILKLTPLDQDQKLKQVNDFVNNNLQYESDQEHYGIVDYWPNLNEAIKFEKEDCDGYAILKYKILSDLGFTDDQIGMCIFVNNESGMAHMATAFIGPSSPTLSDITVTILDYGVLSPNHIFNLESLNNHWKPLVFFNKTKKASWKEIN